MCNGGQQSQLRARVPIATSKSPDRTACQARRNPYIAIASSLACCYIVMGRTNAAPKASPERL